MRDETVAILAFTAAGADTARRLCDALQSAGQEVEGWAFPRYAAACGLRPMESALADWTAQAFSRHAGLVFVGAVGIAVRAIAPFVQDKQSDPAVVAVDEQAQYAIPLLSGHLGGANELAKRIARLTGAEAVITTATDLNGRFAVDSFAKAQGLAIGEMELAKAVSSTLLDGGTVGFCSDFVVEGRLPEGLQMAEEGELGVCVSLAGDEQVFERTLHLVPKIVTLGVGCRQGVSAEDFAAAVAGMLAEGGLSPASVCRVATIDRKAEEPCILAFCERHGLPLFTASAEVLAAMEGDYSGSEFVRETVGVDNVCERAAMLVSGGTLRMRKHQQNGVTAAAAVVPFRVRFSLAETEETL